MNDDNFAKLFKYMEDRFNKIDQKLDKKADKEDVDKILTK